MHQEALYWGLKFGEWVAFAGLILGPVVAVLVTLWVDHRRKTREQRIQIMRMLLSTRHLPGDPAYSVAINLIPIEFNGNKAVMETWRSYIEAVRYHPAPENADEHNRVVNSKQTKLIFEIMKCVGFKLSETDIQTSAYAADGFIKRDNILVGSQIAMIDIATALKRQTEILEGQPPEKPPEQ